MSVMSAGMRRIVWTMSATSLGCGLGGGLDTGLAHAAGASPPAATSEEVTVSVRRRSEPLQKVPVATTVYTASQARRDNVHDLQGIFEFIPSANFRANASSKDRAVFIRGIGTISTSPGWNHRFPP